MGQKVDESKKHNWNVHLLIRSGDLRALLDHERLNPSQHPLSSSNQLRLSGKTRPVGTRSTAEIPLNGKKKQLVYSLC